MPPGRPPARPLALLGVAAAASLAACGGTTTTGETQAPLACSAANATATSSILLSAMQFHPFCATVPVGAELTFTNGDAVDHMVSADEAQPEPFESGLLYPGQQFSYTFSRPETVRVHCRLYPQMSGIVVVQ